jgi:glycosyltransferase involved in cell wall biosynthesis
MHFAGTASYLESKLAAMIGADAFDQFHFLPNPIALAPNRSGTSGPPLVVFLGRLDPYKRPWLFVELARRFPHVSFAMAGRRHHVGVGAWEPSGIPPNVRLLGHVDGIEKTRLLATSTVLVNTSIHEGLAVSLLEGLAFGTPILSCVDPEGIASRFGIYVGDFPGSGENALPALESGLAHLLATPDLRRSLGEAGRRWVEERHTPQHFLSAFDDLCIRLGVGPRAQRKALS